MPLLLQPLRLCKDGSGRLLRGRIQPFSPLLTTPGTIRLLLAAALDSWDRLREAAAGVLLRLPSPLPGQLAAADRYGLVQAQCLAHHYCPVP